jgi:hypothetical protein
MEVSNYASKGQSNLNTVLGSIGTAGALGFLNGGLGGIFGGGSCNCSENQLVNRYEAGQSARIAELETEVKLRDANTYTDSKMLEMYKYFDGRIGCVEHELCDQRVYNATNTAAIGCIQGQVAQLQGLTKLVIPNTSVCPGWGNVTVTPATTTTP